MTRILYVIKNEKAKLSRLNRSRNYFTSITSLFLYVPQALQALCGITSSPHLLHVARFGADKVQLCALRLFLLDCDNLRFGTAIFITPP